MFSIINDDDTIDDDVTGVGGVGGVWLLAIGWDVPVEFEVVSVDLHRAAALTAHAAVYEEVPLWVVAEVELVCGEQQKMMQAT